MLMKSMTKEKLFFKKNNLNKNETLSTIKAKVKSLEMKYFPIITYQFCMEASINIYTDGSSLGNPGPGGYGIILEWKIKITLKNTQKDLNILLTTEWNYLQ